MKKGRSNQKEYPYYPKVELNSDVGRNMSVEMHGRTLSSLVFVKRAEKQCIGQPTSIKHEEFVADIELKITAKQGPSDPAEQKGWVQMLKDYYHSRGYETRLYYRSVGGGLVSGELHQDVASAVDLVMCPKETICLPHAPPTWRPDMDSGIVEQLTAFLANDSLWQQGK